MNVALHQMREEHLEQVLEIERISFSMPWLRQSFAEELENRFAHYFVSVAGNDSVTGYGGMWLIFDEAQVTNVAVHPDYRGNGIGKLLMLGLIRQAALSGCLRMTLEVRSSNLIARHLYETLGFVESGLRKKYYADSGEDAVIMWRDGGLA